MAKRELSLCELFGHKPTVVGHCGGQECPRCLVILDPNNPPMSGDVGLRYAADGRIIYFRNADGTFVLPNGEII